MQAGRPLHEVQVLLGHGSIRITERYVHASNEYMENAIKVFQALEKKETGNRQKQEEVDKIVNLNDQ